VRHPRRSLLDRVRAGCGIALGRLRIHAPRPFAPADDSDVDDATPPLRFAIVTPVLNQAQFVDHAIASIRRQRYAHLDYVVKDGGSTDGTRERAEAACRGLGRLVSCPDDGLANALNQGFANVEGDLYGWLNADDLLLPGTLRHVARFFAEHAEIDVVYGNRVLIDENGAEIGRWRLPAHDDRILSYADYVPQETLFWRRALWERVGARLDESYRFALDWDLLLRFRDAGARFARLPRFLGAFRVHAGQKTWREMETLGVAEKKRLWVRALGHVPSRWQLARGTAAYLARHAILNAVSRGRA
jgi:glycosyltransferase involved in cell wall biosynthesis